MISHLLREEINFCYETRAQFLSEVVIGKSSQKYLNWAYMELKLLPLKNELYEVDNKQRDTPLLFYAFPTNCFHPCLKWKFVFMNTIVTGNTEPGISIRLGWKGIFLQKNPQKMWDLRFRPTSRTQEGVNEKPDFLASLVADIKFWGFLFG